MRARAAFFVIGCASCLGATGVDVNVYTDVSCTSTTPDVAVIVGTDLDDLQNLMTAGVVSATKSGCTAGGALGSRVGDFVLAPAAASRESLAFAVMTRSGGGIADNCGADAGLTDCIIAKRWVGFVPHSTLSLNVQLEQACVGVGCNPDYTCVNGACVPVPRSGDPLAFPTDGLVAYWKLDGDATDASGNGLTLLPSTSLSPGTLQFAPGKFSYGLFPQVAPDVNCSTCVALQSQPVPGLDFSGDFTISLWAKQSNAPFINNGGASQWYENELLGNGQLRLGTLASSTYPAPAYLSLTLYKDTVVTNIGQVEDTTFDFRSQVNDNVFVHVIAFRRGNVIGLRLNGHETTTTISGSVGAPTTFYLGRADDGYPWQGVVDEVGKWNRALTASEMDAIYNVGVGLMY